MNTKQILFFVFSLTNILFFAGCNFFSYDTKKCSQNNLIVGTNSGFPPYEVLNDQGEFEGFDIDLAHHLGKILNKNVIIQDLSYYALILSLKQEKVDLIIAGISITSEKKKEIEMIHYRGKPFSFFPLVFWDKIPEGVTSIDDLKSLKNRTVCVQAGNIQEKYIENYSFINIKNVDAISDLIMEIKHKKAIAFTVDPSVAYEYKKQFPQMKILKIQAPENLSGLGEGIGIKKENTALIKKVSNAINILKNNGELEKLEKKWFKGEVDAEF
jgi:arginine transport system substrate-binding protein